MEETGGQPIRQQNTTAPQVETIDFEKQSACLLHHIDPAANMRRFYYVAVGPGLLDPWVVMRLWGRIGESQHGLATPCQSEEAARKLARQLVRQKLKRGYRVITPRLSPARP